MALKVDITSEISNSLTLTNLNELAKFTTCSNCNNLYALFYAAISQENNHVISSWGKLKQGVPDENALSNLKTSIFLNKS